MSEPRKPFSQDIEAVPNVLRGIGSLLFMAQDACIEIEDDTLLALDCFFHYLADDIEQQMEAKK